MAVLGLRQLGERGLALCELVRKGNAFFRHVDDAAALKEAQDAGAADVHEVFEGRREETQAGVGLLPSAILPDLELSSLVHLLVSHLGSLVGFAMAIVLVANVLRSQRPPGSALAWMLVIVLVPYVGVPLYLVLGGRKMNLAAGRKLPLYPSSPTPHHAAGVVERMLIALGAPPARSGNRVELLPTGEAAFQALVTAIEGATRTLDLSTLILAGDEVGGAILDRLIDRAQAGVAVRVLIDSLFRFRSDRHGLAKLVRAGGKQAWFMPVMHVPFRGHANLRLHRKAVVVDGRLAILGGMNIAREYMGPTPSPGRWHDLSIRLSGPAIGDVSWVFASDWRFATHQKGVVEPSTPPRSAIDLPGAATIQVIGSGPDVASDRIYDALLTAIYTARERLWIATPYFVPDEALAKGFGLAARRGVDVRILVPARSNHRLADLAGASYLREIVAAGGQVLCFQPVMMHAKVAVIDALGIVGSANVDMRSLLLDYEIALFLTSRAEVDQLVGWFEASFRHTRPLPGQVGRGRGLVENVARLFGPLV